MIPAPLVSIEKELRKTEDGTTRSIGFRITLHGKVSAYKGGLWNQPDYPPDQTQYLQQNDRMAGIVDKFGQLADLFSVQNEGQLLEIQPPNGSAPIKGNVRILSINLPENLWVEIGEYTISLEADQLYFGNHLADTDINLATEETWQIEQADDRGRTYRFSHNVGANGKRRYNANGTIALEGWEVARLKVLPLLGIDATKMSGPGVLDLSGWQAYNYVRSQNIDEANGRFSVNETWILFDTGSGFDPQGTDIPCVDSFNMNTRISAEEGITHVSIEGTLTGLEIRDNTNHTLISTKYSNAVLKEAALTDAVLFNRAQSLSGVTLHPTPLNNTVGRNFESGTITYTREYNNRAANIIPGSISETLQVADRLPTDVIAKIGVLNRPAGPILQFMNSKTEKGRSLQIEVVVQPQKYGQTPPLEPNVQPLIDLYGPNGTYGFTFVKGPYIERNEKNWTPRNGRFSRSIGWVYE